MECVNEIQMYTTFVKYTAVCVTIVLLYLCLGLHGYKVKSSKEGRNLFGNKIITTDTISLQYTYLCQLCG